MIMFNYISAAIDIPGKDSLREHPPGLFFPDTGPLSIDVDTHIGNQTVVASLEWKHPEESECNNSSNKRCFYNIDWFLLDCNSYFDVPDCNLPPEHFAETNYFTFNQQVSKCQYVGYNICVFEICQLF